MSTMIRRGISKLSALPSIGVSYTRTAMAYDYAIGGLPFLAGMSKERPLERATADFRKQQFDTGAEPGEQSLASWWLRSQSSFHAGTGLKYEDPDQTNQNAPFQFQDSLGVDVWKAGQATLLPATERLALPVAASVLALGASSAGVDYALIANDSALMKVSAAGAATTVTAGNAHTILSMTQDGSRVYVADDQNIYSALISTGAGGSTLWATGSSSVVIGWAKQRLVAGIGNKLYSLDAAGTGGPALPTTSPGLVYTHPDPNWTWTAIAETASSILVSGFSGANSAVFKMSLDNSGVVPITVATSTAQMPPGEIVYSLLGYLGDYVAMGTNKGVRIATVSAAGDLTWGPLSLVSTQPVRALAGRDRYIFAAAENQLDGASGVWRIDLGTQLDFRRYAYATDLQTHASGTVRSLTLLGSSGRLVIAVDVAGAFVESATLREPTGFLLTGKIRMHTLEPKLFKFLRYRGQPLAGQVGIGVIGANGVETTVGTFSSPGVNPYVEMPVPSLLGPQEYVSLRFSFSRDATDLWSGPTFNGYQLKALPAAKRQRMFRIPVLCFDREKDRNGVQHGSEGSALRRLEALEAVEETGDLVLLQDFSRNASLARVCVIDQLDFVQADPPANASGWGGYLYITLRSVT